jgi:ketosteroid isomerase-like protein
MTEANATAIQALLDKQALTDLIAELSSAVDRADHDRIVSCYAEVSFDDHGSFKGTGAEFADFISTSLGAVPGLANHHLLGQSIFDLKGDEAYGETFFVFHAAFDGASQVAFGRYIDYFRRIDSEWKIVYRRVVPDHTLTGDDITNYWRSSRDHTDPVHDKLREPSFSNTP